MLLRIDNKFRSSSRNIHRLLGINAQASVSPKDARTLMNTLARFFETFNHLPSSMKYQLLAVSALFFTPGTKGDDIYSFTDNNLQANYTLYSRRRDMDELFLDMVNACNSTIPVSVSQLPNDISFIDNECKITESNYFSFELYRSNLNEALAEFESCLEHLMNSQCSSEADKIFFIVMVCVFIGLPLLLFSIYKCKNFVEDHADKFRNLRDRFLPRDNDDDDHVIEIREQSDDDERLAGEEGLEVPHDFYHLPTPMPSESSNLGIQRP